MALASDKPEEYSCWWCDAHGFAHSERLPDHRPDCWLEQTGVKGGGEDECRDDGLTWGLLGLVLGTPQTGVETHKFVWFHRLPVPALVMDGPRGDRPAA
jgi:hypothetical protein